MNRTTVSERGLVLAPRGRDAAVAVSMLKEAGLAATPVPHLSSLIEELQAGAGFVVATEEALATADLHALAGWIEGQEEWSDMPFILLTTRGGGLERNPAAARKLDLIGNVSFIERPFHPTTFVSLVQSALRGRRRQYQARSRLEDLREGEARLRELNETLERRVAEALAERKLFADMVATTEGAFQIMDHDFRYLAINAAAMADCRRIFGVEPKVGQTIHEMLAHAPDQLKSALELWRRALAGESFAETSWWHAAGLPERAYEMQFRPLRDAEGRQIGAFLFGQDVTERVRDQERLAEANARLHEAQKLETLGQLTGGVAHDFNNLLTPIVGALDLLKRRVGGDASSARLLDGALQSGERAKILVQRLLSFARRQALDTCPVDVAELVINMRDLIASSIGPTIELRISAPDGPTAFAVADPNQLELAILNLCVNARDAMPAGGVLTVSIDEVDIDSPGAQGLAPGVYQRISVIDTGVGMDPATLRRAVEPFYSTKGAGKGTGLGLSMVHGLAAQLGGAFVLTSAPGKGTRADFYLPRTAEGAASPLTRPDTPAQAGRRLRLLLVDDEDLVRMGTAEMLRELGHEVTEARGGIEALRHLDTGLEVDAVVTDYKMPNMDGAALAEAVRERCASTPVLVITGYAGGGVQGGLPTLAKPFRQADLGQALREAVEGRSSTVVRLSRVRI